MNTTSAATWHRSGRSSTRRRACEHPSALGFHRHNVFLDDGSTSDWLAAPRANVSALAMVIATPATV
jgi:hypothetical protein